jgi:hypothetical protein
VELYSHLNITCVDKIPKFSILTIYVGILWTSNRGQGFQGPEGKGVLGAIAL